jgi:hypothetical protein
MRLFFDASVAHESLPVLPTKDHSIAVLLDWLDAHRGETVFIRSHCFGDEELLMEVAKHCGERLLFANKSRFDDIQIVDKRFAETSCELLAQDCPCPYGRRVVVVGRGCGGDRRLQHIGGIEVCCSTLWWAMRPDLVSDTCQLVQDAHNVVRVPFSMHSSLSELRRFVGWLRPRRVDPICAFICAKEFESASQKNTRALFDDLLACRGPGSQVSPDLPACPNLYRQSIQPGVARLPPDSSGDHGVAPCQSSSQELLDCRQTAWETTEFFARQPMPPDTLMDLAESQSTWKLRRSRWRDLGTDMASEGFARSLKRRCTATTELDSHSSCSDTLPDDLSDTPLLGFLGA